MNTPLADGPARLLWGAAALAACNDAATENAAYWRGLLAAGPQSLVGNYHVRAGLLVHDGRAWPLTLGHRPSAEAYPASLHSHYVRYPKAELHLVPSPLLRRAARAGFTLFDGLTRLARIDRTVQWSSWLLSTNLHPPDIAATSPEITATLVRFFPAYAVLVRNLHDYLDPHLSSRFDSVGYHLLAARRIYLFDGRTPDFLSRYNVKTDAKALRRLASHRLVTVDDITEADAPRITELYRLLYLEKHSQLNPAYNLHFVRQALRERWFDFRGLRHESGRLDAVCGSFHAHGTATTPFFGYDTTLPPSLGLYRLLVAHLLEDTAASRRVLNYSSGAGAFKRHRGAIPVLEYNALFTRHLPPLQRTAHALLRLFINGPGRRFLENTDV